jgi:intracellular sulfur oxidation DsrE/DsrF family protein
LAIEGSPALEHFKKLEQEGVSILVCGTCLDHFNLLENKQIGETTNMLDVVTSLQLASKVIKV